MRHVDPHHAISHRAVRGRLAAAVLALSLLEAPGALAQASCPDATDPQGHLGFEIACDCTLSRPSSGRPWRFRSPIEVVSVEASGPARDILEPRDRIVAVDGQAITTPAGASRLAELGPGQSLTLTIERAGRRLERRITAAGICTDDDRAWGTYAPFPLTRTAASAPSGDPVQAPAPVPSLPDLQPRGWLGFALACRHCGWAREAGDQAPYWESASPPQVYAVAPDGPADRAGLAAGDVITHVNGAAITSPQGGRTLGAVQPNQQLRLTIRRGTTVREVELRAVAPGTPGAGERRLYSGRTGSAQVEVRGTGSVQVTQEPGDGAITIQVGGTTITVREQRPPR